VAVEDPGEHLGVEQVPPVLGMHVGADARPLADEALRREDLDRLAHDGAAGAEFLAELGFDRQRLPGGKIATHDQRPEPLH
jgi:hypothetical protein